MAEIRQNLIFREEPFLGHFWSWKSQLGKRRNRYGERKPFSCTDEKFKDDILQSDLPVLVDFWAPWRGPCLSIAPAVEELAKVAKEYSGKIKVEKMNVDENPQAPSAFGIRGIPTLILFKGGKAVNQVVGAVPKTRLKAMIEESPK